MSLLSPAPCHISWREPLVWLVPMLALAGIAVLIVSDTNLNLFLYLNRLSTHVSNVLWQNLTVLGSAAVGITLVVPLIGRRPDILWTTALAAIFAILWVHGLKTPIDSFRPPAVIPSELFNIIGPAHRNYSFPSGHTTTIFTIAGILSLYLRRYNLIWILPVAILIGVSRIAVGVHWPLDVLGGALGGWLSAMMGSLLSQYWHWGLSRSGQLVLGVAFGACALGLFIFPDTDYPDAITLQKALALVCLLPVLHLAMMKVWYKKN